MGSVPPLISFPFIQCVGGGPRPRSPAPGGAMAEAIQVMVRFRPLPDRERSGSLSGASGLQLSSARSEVLSPHLLRTMSSPSSSSPVILAFSPSPRLRPFLYSNSNPTPTPQFIL